jgi:hypothetical protein
MSAYLPYQQRVVDEKKDLDERLERLTAFLASAEAANVPTQEQRRMNRQAMLMALLSDTLGERISNFKPQ